MLAAPYRLELLQRQPVPTPPPDDDVDRDRAASEERHLVCRSCRHEVTHDAARMEIKGRHVHLRTNPSQIDFEFACFKEAPGAVQVGEATDEHSWFAGYRWRFAACRRCGSHLGWFFEGHRPAFWGLITSRVVDSSDRSS